MTGDAPGHAVVAQSLRDDSPSLRIDDAALQPSARIAFTFDDATIDALDGETIAAALAAAGVNDLGWRRDGTSRGVWCGMGVCQECLVRVDGVPSVRACMTKVAAGMEVTRQGHRAVAPAVSRDIVDAAPPVERPQVLVVGAGPAGLAAARAAALCGARVLVVDERAAAGGQYFKQLAPSHAVIDPARMDARDREGSALIAEVERLGVNVRHDAVVWAAFGPRELACSIAGTQRVLAPERLILATGVYERAVPVPGWTLAGCMTTGAAQALLRGYRVAPGRRVLVAGNGPLNLQVAAELVAAGVEVVALVEAAAAPRLRDCGAIVRAASAAPTLVRDGLRYRARLRRAGVAMISGSVVTRVDGDARVSGCTVARIDASGAPVAGTEMRYAVDAVCVGYGFLPSNAIARALGCRHARDGATGALATSVDADGATSLDGVYAIGDGVRLVGAHAARHQGFVAGCAAARSLDLPVPAAVAAELAASRRQLRRQLAFQRAMWRLFAAPRLDVSLATDETPICRCEGVTRATIAQALQAGATTLGAVKRRTRAGMGRCQGRYCESLVAAMLPPVADAEVVRDDAGGLAPRAPIVPIRIRDLA